MRPVTAGAGRGLDVSRRLQQRRLGLRPRPQLAFREHCFRPGVGHSQAWSHQSGRARHVKRVFRALPRREPTRNDPGDTPQLGVEDPLWRPAP